RDLRQPRCGRQPGRASRKRASPQGSRKLPAGRLSGRRCRRPRYRHRPGALRDRQHLGDALVAVLVHCPWPDGTLSRIDTSETLAVKGVVKVVQLKPEPGQPWGSTVIAPAVAVLAKDTW